MKAKQIGGGVLVASALVAGWLIVAPPWSGDGRVPAIVTGATDQGSPGADTDKKAPAPASSRATATAAQPVQPTVVAAVTPRPVTGGARAYGYGVMDENGQVIPPPRPAVMTEVRPGTPENETTGTDRGHDRGPNFNLGLYRQADGSFYRP
ncbi:hypothetical protein N5J06_11275 [Ralstonia sp. CHL-2022]|uniref:Uncharacterized protein n=1 Tax=Ralstonia mojiangensis TaxID=2953895 RepID=A0ABT2LA42_9RALS|nr:hypothetical protein [Ralstonia mojiangensis]MCT7298826.1 hypothetical protein [Ralstonia mojiangensis]MCT7311529.1 hypothetical protein [Ralstonia mojiangensis]MCT7328651.1 hypothetical protein [Ralstonia mojiangensis]